MDKEALPSESRSKKAIISPDIGASGKTPSVEVKRSCSYSDASCRCERSMRAPNRFKYLRYQDDGVSRCSKHIGKRDSEVAHLSVKEKLRPGIRRVSSRSALTMSPFSVRSSTSLSI
jgi:hypothetical protein